jgi:acetyl-CoA carboxylase biotin carboxyl carrier protein
VATRERDTLVGHSPEDAAISGNLDEIKTLIDLVIEKGLTEFELERSGLRIRIARNTAPAAPAPQSVDVAASGALKSAPSQPASGTMAHPASSAAGLHTVRSPMVGTFYASPSPESEPFVRAGDRIEAGQVLCIIEAMKLMNEIEAEMAGEVIKCYVENGQPVEYGEPLFDIRPLGSGKRSS